MMPDEKKPPSETPDHDGFAFPPDRPTRPASKSSRLRAVALPFDGWGVERAAPTGQIVSVTIFCRGCMRQQKLAPPRFRVDADGLVTDRDQGLAFTCPTCATPVGPIRLTDWKLGPLA